MSVSRTTMTTSATIRDVLGTLVAPENYVCVVLEHMTECRKRHGSATVRIGITGQGLYPSHKILYSLEEGGEDVFGAWSDRTRFTETLHEDTWSSAHMTLSEVKELLADIRQIKRRVMVLG